MMKKADVVAFRFDQACKKMLEMAGAIQGDSASYPLRLETVAGTLQCAPYEDWLACRFEDVERAKKLIGPGQLNPFSGKWNWHYTRPTARDLIGLQAVIASVAVLSDEQQEILDGFEASVLKMSGEPVDVMLSYQYRDGDNYKTGRSVYFQGGSGNKELLKALMLAMDNSESDPSFIPGLIGLDDLQDSFGAVESQWDPDRDHPWHTLESVEVIPRDGRGIRETVTFAEFVQGVQVRGLVDLWDENYLPDFHPTMAARYARAQLAANEAS